MANVLSIGTYPVSVPRHGGQIRANAIQQIYQEAGHVAQHVAVYQETGYPDEPQSPWNVHFSPAFLAEMAATGGRSDVNATDFLLKDAHARGRVLNLILQFDPDIIQLEQCYMWPIIKMLRKESERLRLAHIIYSSHNVEHELLPMSVGPEGPSISESTVKLVRKMEMDLAKNADLIISLSNIDAEVFQPLSKCLVLAPNGIWPRVRGTGQDYWKKEFHGRRNAVFIGSGHPPNAIGFNQLLGPSLGFLSPTERIVVVGGAGHSLYSLPAFRENLGINLARAMLVGVQDPGGLSTIIELADAIIVPITQGGGTNIKMAEALYSRKPVICTSKAMRGYEAFLDLPFVIVRDTAEKFQAALVEVLRGELNVQSRVTRSQAHRLDKLLWSSTLGSLEHAIEALMTNKANAGMVLNEKADHYA